MLVKTAELIRDSAESLGHELSIRENYKVPGTANRQTCGVVVQNVGVLLSSIADAAASLIEQQTDDQKYTIDHFINDLSKVQSRPIGLLGIIYY